MVRPSHVRRLARLVLGLACLGGLTVVPAVRAADKSTPVKFPTKDQVELVGTFYPSPKGKDEPTVLLLHKYGSDSHKDGWDALAEQLQEKGFSVLSFDFRGHGKSTAVERGFWKYPFNQTYVRGFNPQRPRETISVKDFNAAYMPYLLNDIAAAKFFLDERNDAGECNSRALILVGAEEGAALGALWMGSEWYRRPAVLFEQGAALPPIIQRVDMDEQAGKDQYAAVWLSMTGYLGGRSLEGAVRAALGQVAKEKKVPMAFVYGQKDDRAAGMAGRCLSLLKAADKDAQKLTNAMPIKDTKLAGSALLRPELGTAEWVSDKYLGFLREKLPPPKWSRIDFERNGYVWILPGQRLPVLAKGERAKTLEPVPVERLLAGQ